MSEAQTSELTRADVPKLRNIPVVTSDGEEIGHVGDAYYDEDSDRLQCVGVAGDALGLTKRVVPVGGATIDADGRLRLPYTRDQIEGSPEWGDDVDDDMDDDRYDEVRGYYGGEAEGQTITRSEEELAVGKREVEAGSVRLRKWVETEPVETDVELRRETATVTREPVNEVVGDVDLREQEIEVPLHEERPVVEKQAVAKERVGIERDVETQRQTVSDEVRKERVDLEEDR
jgi:uncharacterized protein (TIGR02271 family)